MSFKYLIGAVAGLTMAALAFEAQAANISGAGATFPYPIYAKWAQVYSSLTGDHLNYQSIGSGGGIAQIKAKTVTFGASDKPLKPAELDKHGQTEFIELRGLERFIRRAKRHRLCLDLRDTAARSNRLVVQMISGQGGVHLSPLRVDRVGKRSARAGNVCRLRFEGERRHGETGNSSDQVFEGHFLILFVSSQSPFEACARALCRNAGTSLFLVRELQPDCDHVQV